MRPAALLCAVLLLAPALASCTATHPGRGDRPAAALASSDSVRVVATGDIACPPGAATDPRDCHAGATYRRVRALGPDLVLALGDTQYQRGTLADYRASYAQSWGHLLAITRPVPGNHEYKTSGARGYYRYFRDRQPGPPGYYRVRAGHWQVYLLNSNCDRINCAREARWLGRAMNRHPTHCSLLAMHHPRYSSGREHGNDPAVRGLWRVALRHHADLVLAGHDHDYERFARMGADGQRSRHGMVEIVAGAGGRSLYRMGSRKPGSRYFTARHFGVLRLDLRPRSWTSAFVTTGGAVVDRGRHGCV